MSGMRARRTLAILLLGAAVPGCGDPPVPLHPVNVPEPVPEQTPSPHAVGFQGAGTVSGTIRLRGPHAVPQGACLFVSVMPAGTRRPLCSTKIQLADPSLGTSDADGRAIPFALENCAAFDGTLELQVWFDLDGFVDTQEEGTLIRHFQIGEGKDAIDVTLEPE
jgi:hypothetical protein